MTKIDWILLHRRLEPMNIPDLYTMKMIYTFMTAHSMAFPGRIAWFSIILLFSSLTMTYSMEPEGEEEIETLDVIEITGSVVEQHPRNLNFPPPSIQAYAQIRQGVNIQGPEFTLSKPLLTHSSILLDQTANTKELHTPVKPLQTERPPFPRRAREQGWHGRVIVRLEISPNGTVESSTIQESSGHQLLDDGAIKAASHWTFEPAKNGGFPVAATVNIPIQFDLIQ